ncbi:aminotransferase class I/II-fold pyridoxal phosphate-dependent enzyme [Nocardiopsis dassonvillei]
MSHTSNMSTDLLKTVAEIASYETHEIDPGKLMIDDLGFDSIMIMDLVSSLANNYPQIRAIDPWEDFQDDITYADLELRLHALVEDTPADAPAAPEGIARMEKIVQFGDFLRGQEDLPYFAAYRGIAANTISVGARTFVNYSSYNYLGTNGHPRIRKAVDDAVAEHGTSVSASRLIGGEIGLHGELERTIADFIGVDDALVQVGGHSTNVNILGNLFGEDDLILHDSLAHNSLIQGALLSDAKRKPFKHNDMENLEQELARLRPRFRNVVIVVEGVYSMDGDLCPLPELLRIKEHHDAFLMIDEAHSIGTVGRAGRGVASHFGVDPRRVDIHMGTLSKAFNSCGGYIAGSRGFVEYLRYNLPGFVFSVGMTPANTAAALESIRLCQENPHWIDELHGISQRFLGTLRDMGLDTGKSGGTPVVPLITGDSALALRFSEQLHVSGINVAPILHPAVREDEARLRFFLSRLHTEEDLEVTFKALNELEAAR